ncbi:S-adenosyl-L-methionine-dependent methyltransferase [Dactylonectria macrodidyma]|uniref:S-adenosyl-L-methionine-dependent methyltransferase n=1 Tax=Dactylonectria macrodidyma TaxID=307937 RepID=A0A9P9J7W3_9HYPO|nr:S-adenosyl-L-methionine-dependent methyltransferase [Dactylonectria macrodidyma]
MADRTPPETHIAPDDHPINDVDSDSAFGDLEGSSSTTSITTSVLHYRRENGRTYHAYKDGKYTLPNDEMENERLDLQHNLLILTLNDKLGLAPPNNRDSKVKHVLDVGTGTGIWALDFADEHPEAEVIGVDLSPIQPSFVPPNLSFQIDDIEDDWTYSKPFDYIHSSFMTASIANWTEFLTKCFNNLEPGGYVEIQEPDLAWKSDDGSLAPDSALLQCAQLLQQASEKFGRAYQDIPSLVNIMKEIGFVDVVIETFKWPNNPWPKDKRLTELGAWVFENFSGGLEGITLAPLTRAHGWSPHTVRIFLVDVRKALGDKNIHAYMPIYSIYGRRPKIGTE